MKQGEGERVHICDSLSLTADERKSFEVDVVLFLQWLRLNTDAGAEQHIHHFNDTFSGRSPAQAEINSTLVPCAWVKQTCSLSLTHTHAYKYPILLTYKEMQVLWVCKGHVFHCFSNSYTQGTWDEACKLWPL